MNEMIEITVKFGLKNWPGMRIEEGSTVNDVAEDFEAQLGLPESWTATVNDNRANGDQTLVEGDVVYFEQAECKKAS